MTPEQITGALIVNADDWGRDELTTNRTLDCFVQGTVSSVSAMVFMEDSERAAGIARKHGIDAGLHLNLTTRFSAPVYPEPVAQSLQRIARYLLRSPFTRAVFHPGLRADFATAVQAQVSEFQRLYGAAPARVDGHHHMHLSANVLFGGLLPAGAIVRRHFSFEPGEKAVRNGVFRLFTQTMLAGHATTDYFFSLPPLKPEERLQRIFSLARRQTVEVETHPVNPDEYDFLTGGEMRKWGGDSLAQGYAVPAAHGPQQEGARGYAKGGG